MNIEDIKNVILEAFGEVREEKETADSPDTHKITDLPKSLQKSITARYGVGKYPERDFLSSDMKTLFRTISVDKNTGSVGHKIISLPSFNGLYKDYSDIIADLKELMRSPDIQRDQKAKDLFELIRTNFRKLQSYLRTERPEQYELMRMRRSMEEAVTGLKRLKYDNLNEAKKDIYDKFLDNPSSPKGRAKSLILKFTKEYGDGASSMAVDRFASKNNLKPEEKYILKYITKNDIKISSQSGGPDFSAVSEAEMKEGWKDMFKRKPKTSIELDTEEDPGTFKQQSLKTLSDALKDPKIKANDISDWLDDRIFDLYGKNHHQFGSGVDGQRLTSANFRKAQDIIQRWERAEDSKDVNTLTSLKKELYIFLEKTIIDIDEEENPNVDVKEALQEAKKEIDEAEFKGKKVALGKPKRGGPKAYYVYVKDGDKVKKVTFGSGGLRAKIKNKEARNAFAARHKCSTKKDRTKAGYWSCNLPRYASQLGLGANQNTYW